MRFGLPFDGANGHQRLFGFRVRTSREFVLEVRKWGVVYERDRKDKIGQKNCFNLKMKCSWLLKNVNNAYLVYWKYGLLATKMVP